MGKSHLPINGEDQLPLFDGFAELTAARLGHRHDLGLDRRGQLRDRGLFPALPGSPARPGLLRGLLGGVAGQHLERGLGSILLGFLLARAVARAEWLRSCEHDRGVLTAVAHAGALAVIDRGFAKALLRDLLQAPLEVLVARGSALAKPRSM